MALTQKRLRELLDYDPQSGVFRWKQSPRARVQPGDEAGCPEQRYTRIQINGRRYMAHRLAWLWVTGEWPPEQIDHKDRNTHNNAWSNLRAADHSLNAANRTARVNNKSGFKGVHLLKSGKYGAFIKKDGRSINLGSSFTTPQAAHEAYCAAAERLFGDFARAA